MRSSAYLGLSNYIPKRSFAAFGEEDEGTKSYQQGGYKKSYGSGDGTPRYNNSGYQ